MSDNDLTLGDALDDESDDDVTYTNTDYPVPFDNPIPEKGIGHIAASGEPLKVGRQENNIKAWISPSEQEDIEVGDYIRIPYYNPNNKDVEVNEQLLASVDSLMYENQMKGMSDTTLGSAETYGSEQYAYLATLNPISIVSMDDPDAKYPFDASYVSKPPKPTVRLDHIQDAEFLRSGLEIPQDGIYLGDMSVNGNRVPDENNPLEYYLSNPNATDDTSTEGESALFRHLFVGGSTGTGKTHLSKNILRQIAKCKKYEINDSQTGDIVERRMNLTILDPEGEYTQMADDPDESIEDVLANRNGIEHGGIVGTDVSFNVYRPMVKGSSISDDSDTEYQTFGIPFSIVANHPKLLMPSDPQGPTKKEIRDVIYEYFGYKDTNADGTYSEFINWFETEKIGAQLEDNLRNAVERRIKSPTYDMVFDRGSKQLLDDTLVSDMFRPGQVNVITTGHLNGQANSLIMQALLSHIVDNKIKSDVDYTAIKEVPLMLALDEAHEYLSEPDTTREFAIVNKFRTAARRGRKDLFGLYLISQNPDDIDEEVTKQINTKIYLKLDGQVVDSSGVYIPPKFKKQITEFDQGQMVVKQPNVRSVEVLGLPVCLTKHD